MTSLRICVEKQNLPLAIKDDLGRINSNLRAAFLRRNIWPSNSKIRIGFYSPPSNIDWTPLYALQQGGQPLDPLETQVRNLSPSQAIIKVVNERIVPLVNLDIKFVPDVRQANIRIAFNKDGAWSYVGNDALNYSNPNVPTMNFEWLDVATIIHEFGHAMGMIHEHQNPFGKPIDWNDKAVLDWAHRTQGWSDQTTRENILDRYDSNQLNGSNYDPKSIMLYFFPPELTNDKVGTKQNTRLSPTDCIWLSKMYEGGSITPVEFYKKVYNENIIDNSAKPISTQIEIPSTNQPDIVSISSTSPTKPSQTNGINWANLIPSPETAIVVLIIGLVVFMAIYFTRQWYIRKNKASKKGTSTPASEDNSDVSLDFSIDDDISF